MPVPVDTRGMKGVLLSLIILLVGATACNEGRTGRGGASGLLDDVSSTSDVSPDPADSDVVVPDAAPPVDAADPDADVIDRDLVDDQPIPDVPDAPSVACLAAGFELDCSDPQWQVPPEFAEFDDPCTGELIYSGPGEHLAYGTRDNPGILSITEVDGGIRLESRGVDPPTGVLCSAFVECDSLRPLTSFEGPGFGVSFVEENDRTHALRTRWGAHRSMPSTEVNTGPVDSAWSIGDSTSWILLTEFEARVRRWRDISADSEGQESGMVGTMVGAGSEFGSVDRHRYFALGTGFDGLVSHSFFDVTAWDGPFDRARPISGADGIAALAESSLDDRLVLLGEADVSLGLPLRGDDQVIATADRSQVFIARLTADGLLEVGTYRTDTGEIEGWNPVTPLGNGATLIAAHVHEMADESRFAITVSRVNGDATGVFVVRPLDPRCD